MQQFFVPASSQTNAKDTKKEECVQAFATHEEYHTSVRPMAFLYIIFN